MSDANPASSRTGQATLSDWHIRGYDAAFAATEAVMDLRADVRVAGIGSDATQSAPPGSHTLAGARDHPGHKKPDLGTD